MDRTRCQKCIDYYKSPEQKKYQAAYVRLESSKERRRDLNKTPKYRAAARRLDQKPVRRAKLREYDDARYHRRKVTAERIAWTRCAASRRRARIRGAAGTWTWEQFASLCESFNNRCLRCGEGGRLSPDHVIALANGGENTIENIQPLCKPCNSSKGSRHSTDYRKTPHSNCRTVNP